MYLKRGGLNVRNRAVQQASADSHAEDPVRPCTSATTAARVIVVGVQRYSTGVVQLDSREKGGTVPCF